MTHAQDTQRRFNEAQEPDLLRVWNWMTAFGVMCDSLTPSTVRRLCDLVCEHRCEGTPFDMSMRGRVEDILYGGTTDGN